MSLSGIALAFFSGRVIAVDKFTFKSGASKLTVALLCPYREKIKEEWKATDLEVEVEVYGGMAEFFERNVSKGDTYTCTCQVKQDRYEYNGQERTKTRYAVTGHTFGKGEYGGEQSRRQKEENLRGEALVDTLKSQFGAREVADGDDIPF